MNFDTLNKLLEQGRAARRQGDSDRLLEVVDQLLGLTMEEAWQDWRPAALNLAAQCARDQGDSELALGRYRELAELLDQDQDGQGLAHCLRHMADLHREAGQHRLAAAGYQLVLNLYRNDRDTSALDLANALRGYALLQGDMDEISAAMDLWLEASELYEACGIEAGVQECEQQLATLDARRGADSA